MIDSIPEQYSFGIVKQRWLDLKNGITDHTDIRFIRNKCNCRYDLKFPIHEAFMNTADRIIDLTKYVELYQDRIKYGGTTEKRYHKDIEYLLKAEKNKRNYYYLAQSYMSIDDYENGFKYNVMSLETDNDESNVNEKFTYTRAGFCAMICKMSETIIMKYLHEAIQCDDPPVDAYVYILKYYVDNKKPENCLKYLKVLYDMKKPQEISLVNHQFYDYTRYHLISVVALMTNQEIFLGFQACLKALEFANKSEDIQNMSIYRQII